MKNASTQRRGYRCCTAIESIASTYLPFFSARGRRRFFRTADRFLLLRTRGSKGGARRGGVSFDASKQTFRVSSAKVHLISSYSKSRILILNKWRQSTISRSEVVLVQSEIKARAHQISRRCR